MVWKGISAAGIPPMRVVARGGSFRSAYHTAGLGVHVGCQTSLERSLGELVNIQVDTTFPLLHTPAKLVLPVVYAYSCRF